ncbi:hypothetical protein PUN28_015552 [Cardiocondyla obscurior]|uniref:Uncharacterized protein n=1 Tax=Cardiocondyla obscurior TaxID=286306 RepID=A0AAW2EYM2_9HYME
MNRLLVATSASDLFRRERERKRRENVASCRDHVEYSSLPALVAKYLYPVIILDGSVSSLVAKSRNDARSRWEAINGTRKCLNDTVRASLCLDRRIPESARSTTGLRSRFHADSFRLFDV